MPRVLYARLCHAFLFSSVKFNFAPFAKLILTKTCRLLKNEL